LIRTFFALEIPASLRRELAEIIRVFQTEVPRGIKWVSDENLHITLQFIGDTKEEDLPEIIRFFQNVFSEIGKLEFIKPEIQIISGRFPRIVWVSLKTKNREVAKAVGKIRNKLQELGYKPDSKPLKFHITLGRVKRKLSEHFIADALRQKISAENIEVSEAVFYRSILRSDGPVYEKIEVFHLSNNKNIEE